jgi:hypothetical protein
LARKALHYLNGFTPESQLPREVRIVVDAIEAAAIAQPAPGVSGEALREVERQLDRLNAVAFVIEHPNGGLSPVVTTSEAMHMLLFVRQALRREPSSGEALRALQGLANARQSCEAPSDAYNIPCACCQRTAALVKAALAPPGESPSKS